MLQKPRIVAIHKDVSSIVRLGVHQLLFQPNELFSEKVWSSAWVRKKTIVEANIEASVTPKCEKIIAKATRPALNRLFGGPITHVVVSAQAHQRNVWVQRSPNPLKVLDLLLKDEVSFPSAHNLLPTSQCTRKGRFRIDQVPAHADEEWALITFHRIDFSNRTTRELNLLAPAGVVHSVSLQHGENFKWKDE